MKPDAKDIAYIVGLALLCVGFGGYDWRWGVLAGGTVLFTTAILAWISTWAIGPKVK